MRTPEIWPGPMEGIMFPALITVAAELELIERWMTPFWRVSNAVPKTGKLKKFVAPFQVSDLPLTVQLMGNDPVLLGECGARFSSMGIRSFNLNFGCPSNQVCRHGGGGRLLQDPRRMVAMLSTLSEQLPGDAGISAKIRVGWENVSELEDIVGALADWGKLDFLVVHYRTVRELYRIIPDGLDRLSRVIKLFPGPVIGNGDICCVEDGLRMLEQTRCAGLMVARGWLQDPYLLRRLVGKSAPAPEEGRRIFFRKVWERAMMDNDGTFGNGQAIELAVWLWGKENPVLPQLQGSGADGWKRLQLLFEA